MSETRTITCDGCNRDLSRTGFATEYRLALTPQVMQNYDAAVMGWVDGPPIEAPAHFCDLKCLRSWLDRLGGGHGAG